VSEAVANQLFPDEDPIGKWLVTPFVTATIVGIVKDVRHRGLDQESFPTVYIMPNAYFSTGHICLLVRTSLDAETAAGMLRRIVHEMDPTLPVTNIATIDQIISESTAGRRFYTTATTAFAALALLLTAAGLIVVIARSVAERRRELAVRAALGAHTGDLVRLVTRQGLMPVFVGAAVGLWGAWMGSALLRQFLFEVTHHDPVIYLAAGGLVVAVAFVGCLIPARRISKLHPAAALQSE
jgi:predicted lysophospholipase L1 biosynthesis ABC-type transport system permease subunit